MELIGQRGRKRLRGPERSGLRPVVYVLSVAGTQNAPALIQARWSIAVSPENGHPLPGQVIDPDAIRIERGGIGVAGRKCARSVAEVRPVWFRKGAEQRL